MNDDEFVDVIDFSGAKFAGYQINRKGEFRSCRKQSQPFGFSDSWHPLRTFFGRHGYLQITLQGDDGRGKVRRVHALLLLAFVGPPGPKQGARHLDGDQTNNSLENLRWGSQQENIDDKRRHGTMARGSRVGGSKLTEDQVREIRRLSAEEGMSYKQLGKMFGVDPGTPYHILKGKTWKHVV